MNVGCFALCHANNARVRNAETLDAYLALNRLVWEGGPLSPATIEDHASVGLSWEPNDAHALSLGYTYAVENTIQGQSVFTGPQTGHVKMHQHIVDVAYSYRF